MEYFIIDSDINNLVTLRATFPPLSYAQLTIYSTSDKQGHRKNRQFSAVVRSPSQLQTNIQTPGILVLPSYLWLKYQITSDRGKALNRDKNAQFDYQQRDQYDRQLERNVSGIFHSLLNIYSIGDKKGWFKTYNLLQ